MTAFETIAARSDAPLFIFGDHASAHIPAAFDNLGLSGRDLTRHIAIDIGTEGVIRHLANQFGCSAHLCAVSRLVIDCNRPVGSTDLVIPVSDGTIIPGNQHLTPEQVQSRVDSIHTPYHKGLSRAIVDVMNRHDDPLIISVHSFTPKPDTGERRGVEIGFLVKSDPKSADAAVHEFNTISMNYDVRINEPYTAHILNHTVDTQVAERGLRHLNIEIRQDLIDTDGQQKHMAEILSRIIGPVMRKRPVAPLP